MRTNIFICFTQYQYKSILDILSAKNIHKDNNTILITTFKVNNTSIFSKIIFIEKINSFSLFFKEILARKRKNSFLNLYNEVKDNNIAIFIPHYLNINTSYITNFLFPNATINIIPDGILSFYPKECFLDDYYLQFKYYIVSLLIGLKYKIFFSNLIDPFKKINIIYSYNPDMTVDYNKDINLIESPKRTINKAAKNILILGTTRKVHKEDKIIKLLKNLLNENNNLYYKLHPSIKKDDFYKKLQSEFSCIKLISSNNMAEDIVKELNIKTAVSVEFSTTVIELQRLYQNKFNCYINLTKDNKLYIRYKLHFDKLLDYYNIQNIKD